jgi:alpha-L-arabinofuranosidase
VKIGCLAQLVNVIAPIRSEPGGPAWRQASFHPFALTSRHGRGTVLRTETSAPVYDTAQHGEVPLLDAVAVADPDHGSVTVFAVNRDQHLQAAVELDLRGFPALIGGDHVAVCDDNPDAVNTAEQPDRVTPRRRDDVKVSDGQATLVLPPLSWNVVRLRGGAA